MKRPAKPRKKTIRKTQRVLPQQTVHKKSLETLYPKHDDVYVESDLRPLPPEPIILSSENVPHTKKQTRFFVFAGVCLLLIAGVWFVRAYYFPTAFTPQEIGEKDVKATMLAVAKLMELPQGIPSVATVTDVTKLQSQPFFSKAVNGDKVLIFADAKRAILYRPSAHRIIDVSPLFSAPVNPTPLPTLAPATFIIRNGTTVNGLTKSYETELKEKISTATIKARENASSFEFTQSMLVAVSNRPDSEAVAQALTLPLQTLPKGESSPAADFLIILGQNAVKN